MVRVGAGEGQVGALRERGEVRVVLDQDGAVDRVHEAGIHGGPVAGVAARRAPPGVDRGGHAHDGEQSGRSGRASAVGRAGRGESVDRAGRVVGAP